MQPWSNSNFQHQIEAIVRKAKVMHVANAGDNPVADSKPFRVLARERDHCLNGIDGLNGVTVQGQLDAS